MDKLAFVFILLGLIAGATSSKIEGSGDDASQAPNIVFPAHHQGRKMKTCRGVHSIVSNRSVATKTVNQSNSIQRVIHVTFKSIEEMPACVADTFKKINPDFEVRKWGDEEIIEFLKKDFSQKHADFFKSIPAGEIKADFFRLAVLWKLGGWYLDMDVGLKQPLDKIADPEADMILSGSLSKHRVNPIIFAAKPGNKVILHTIENMFALRGSKFDYWAWSVCPQLYKTLNEEFDGKFEPSNIVATKTSPNGLKVQMMEEKFCSFGPGPGKQKATLADDLVANNEHGCQPGLTNMAGR